MTTTPATFPPPTGRVRFTGVLASEWTKLRSLRSTVWSLLAASAVLVGFALLFTWGVVTHWEGVGPVERLAFDPTATSLGGVFLAQLPVGVLGVLALGGEFSTGMIRGSFTAVPKRLPVLWGKALVFGCVTAALMTATCLAAFYAGQAVLSGRSLQTTLGADGVLRSVVGAAVFLTWVGLFGLGLGAVLRSSAAAIGTLVGVLLVVPVLVGFLPPGWRDHLERWLPGSAGGSLMSVHPADAQLTPGGGLLVLAVDLLAVLGAAAVLLGRRDV